MQTRYLLAIQQLTKVGFPGVGAKSVRQLYDFLPVEVGAINETAAASQILTAYEQLRKLPRNGKLIPLDLEGFSRAVEQADILLDKCAAHGVEAIGCDDHSYPKRLLAIEDRPLVVYVKGNLDTLNPLRVAAFVGTREPSDYGRKAGEKLASLLTKAGLTIVSGLAAGCDTIGHRACLDNEGQTVAVLAGGLDHIYPKENKGLATEILEKGGCWLAEHPVGIRPQSNFFVERDRLQSGLSDGVVVLETDVKGGTMHTVKFTQLQGRTLACFKHPPKYADHPKAQGNQLLLREGKAMPLGSPSEIDAFLAHLRKAPEKKTIVSQPLSTTQPTLF